MTQGYAISGYECYKLYVSIKAHFNQQSYDFVRYGVRKIAHATYDKRADKYFFEKLANKYTRRQVLPFLVANMVIDPDIWIGELVEESAHDTYLEFVRIQSSLYEVVKDDLKDIKQFAQDRNISVRSMFEVVDGKQPIILRFFLQGLTNRETLVIMNDTIKFFDLFDKKLTNDYVWSDIYSQRFIKYSVFLKFNKEKYHELINSILL